MTLSLEDEALISIILANSRRIDEILKRQCLEPIHILDDDEDVTPALQLTQSSPPPPPPPPPVPHKELTPTITLDQEPTNQFTSNIENLASIIIGDEDIVTGVTDNIASEEAVRPGSETSSGSDNMSISTSPPPPPPPPPHLKNVIVDHTSELTPSQDVKPDPPVPQYSISNIPGLDLSNEGTHLEADCSIQSLTICDNSQLLKKVVTDDYTPPIISEEITPIPTLSYNTPTDRPYLLEISLANCTLDDTLNNHNVLEDDVVNSSNQNTAVESSEEYSLKWEQPKRNCTERDYPLNHVCAEKETQKSDELLQENKHDPITTSVFSGSYEQGSGKNDENLTELYQIDRLKSPHLDPKTVSKSKSRIKRIKVRKRKSSSDNSSNEKKVLTMKSLESNPVYSASLLSMPAPNTAIHAPQLVVPSAASDDSANVPGAKTLKATITNVTLSAVSEDVQESVVRTVRTRNASLTVSDPLQNAVVEGKDTGNKLIDGKATKYNNIKGISLKYVSDDKAGEAIPQEIVPESSVVDPGFVVTNNINASMQETKLLITTEEVKKVGDLKIKLEENKVKFKNRRMEFKNIKVERSSSPSSSKSALITDLREHLQEGRALKESELCSSGKDVVTISPNEIRKESSLPSPPDVLFNSVRAKSRSPIPRAHSRSPIPRAHSRSPVPRYLLAGNKRKMPLLEEPQTPKSVRMELNLVLHTPEKLNLGKALLDTPPRTRRVVPENGYSVYCWDYCPTKKKFPRSLESFIFHLNKDHNNTSHTYLSLQKKKVVCVCVRCEVVVEYTEVSKLEHVKKHGSAVIDFYIYIENNHDNALFGITHLNAPMLEYADVKYVESVSGDACLDTIVWRNIRGDSFCYHYCARCNLFVMDSSEEVDNHIKSFQHNSNKIPV